MPDASHSQQDWLLNEQVLWRHMEITVPTAVLFQNQLDMELIVNLY